MVRWLATWSIALAVGCYRPPEPDCGFVCGPAGACPADYTCAADHRCHRDGSSPTLTCPADAAIDAPDAPGDAALDATIDASGDAAPMDATPDAPIDATVR